MNRLLLALCAGLFLTFVLIVANRDSSDTTADERGMTTPETSTLPPPETPVPIATSVPGAITEADAVAIAHEVAQVKGDANAALVSVENVTLKDALTALSPGMELIGYDLTEPVFVVRFRGGPFDRVRSIPLNRKAEDYISNGLFVVVLVNGGDVIGSGALRYEGQRCTPLASSIPSSFPTSRSSRSRKNAYSARLPFFA